MSHSPPICESYPQLNKEQAMYNIIQESISPGLIREPHSPKDTIAILDANVPRTLSQANKFIGALSWYRKFIQNVTTASHRSNSLSYRPY
ncbi:unnamed protein product [Rotaria magnacalcarata]|uniref:Reverse transcriptase n=1 Tax=Rotaria magnacalcarata TaxID=392030 RepID=A0A816TWV8_9BILA|nr:unnamed protein product [Rotaria magnacalcarata]